MRDLKEMQIFRKLLSSTLYEWKSNCSYASDGVI